MLPVPESKSKEGAGTMKKLISALCAAVCLAAGLPRAARGESRERVTSGGYGYTVRADGTAVVTSCPAAGGTVDIPAELDGVRVAAVGPVAISGGTEKAQVWRIRIAEGVLSLEDDAFSGLVKLNSVTLPDSLTAIGKRAFFSCKKLASVRLPAALKTIGDEAFAGCGLKAAAFPEGLEEIGSRAFDGCPLKELAFPVSLRRIGDEAFRGNGRPTVRKVFFPGMDTELGERIFGYTYPGDGKTLGSWSAPLPASLKVPALAVTCLPGSTADLVFRFNVKKQYPKWDEAHIRTAPADRIAVAGLYSMEDQVYELVIPEGVEEIADSAFDGLRTLCRLSLPSTLRAIGRNAFRGCSALEEVALPESLETLGEGCFSGCSSLKEIRIPAGVKEIPERAFSECFRLESLVLPEGLEAIGAEAFSQDPEIVEFVWTAYGKDDHYSALKALKLPASLKTVGKGAFSCCDALAEISFAENSLLAELGDYAFAGCVRLKKLVLPGGLRSVGAGAFMDDHALSAVTVPDTVAEIGDSVFEGCPKKLSVACGKGSAMEKYMKRYEGVQVNHP